MRRNELVFMDTMAARVAEIWRNPVKELAGERFDRVAVTAVRTLPQDRRFAIAHGDSGIAAEAPRWALKTNFHMRMHGKDERLAGRRLAPSSPIVSGAAVMAGRNSSRATESISATSRPR